MTGPIDMIGTLSPMAGPSAAQRLTAKGTEADKTRLAQASRDLESLFIYHMLQQMRATVPESGLLSGGRAETMYRQMLDSEMAKNMAAQRGFGLARMMQENLAKTLVKSPAAEGAAGPPPGPGTPPVAIGPTTAPKDPIALDD